MYILVIVIYILLGLFELRPLYIEKRWRDLVANALFMLFSFILAILISIGFKPPSPLNPVTTVITSVFGK